MKKELSLALSLLVAAGLVVAVLWLFAWTAPTAALAPAQGAAAGAATAPRQVTGTFEVIATGLDNPRGLTFAPNGDLFIAEAGQGGEAPCFPGPEGAPVCYGTTGAVTRVSGGTQERIVTGLSSVAEENGSNAGGPHDVSIGPDGTIYVLMGLGANPAVIQPTGTLSMAVDLGRLITVTEAGAWAPVANLAAYEAANNPAGGPLDSNPFRLVTRPDGSHMATDAGGNDLLGISPSGAITTLAVFSNRLITFPPGTTNMIPMEPVPTGLAVGPDGATYVGQLTGFPFPPGGANVYRVLPGQITPTVFMTGFTNIVGLAFGADQNMYVLEMFANGLLSGDPMGAIYRVAPDGSRELMASTGLTTPLGITVGPDHALYVTNMATVAGAGTVIRIPTPLSEHGVFMPFVAKQP